MGQEAKPCLLLGYLEHTQGYRLYDKKTNRIFRCRDVVFYEDETTKTNYRMEPINDSEEDDESDSAGDRSEDLEESFKTPTNEVNSERKENQDASQES